jgi:arylsulfatase A-like enzyme
LLVALSAGCEHQSTRPNLLLLSIDTLRADHLGCYGYDRNTSPTLDRLAARSVLYSNAWAPAPSTLPSHVAMLSGQHPYALGITSYSSSLPTSVPMLAEALSGAGYQTVALVDSSSAGMLGGEHGFARGFDQYRHAPHESSSAYRYDMSSSVDSALSWLASRDQARPFFMLLHTKSVHTAPADPVLLARSTAPYDKPEPFGNRFLPGEQRQFDWTDEHSNAGVRYLMSLNERIAAGRFDSAEFSEAKLQELIDLYDGGIYYVDLQLQRLLEGLEGLGLAGDTIIIVTADHGEAFLEHHLFLHKEPVDETLGVPLIVYDPRRSEGAVVSRPVTLMDIPAAILSMAGVPAPASMTGRRLPGLGGSEIHEPVESSEPEFSYYHFEQDGLYEAYSLAQGPWRLLHHRLAHWGEFRTELYARATGLTEAQLVVDRPETARQMLGQLLESMDMASGVEPESIELDGETLEQLRALGYLK